MGGLSIDRNFYLVSILDVLDPDARRAWDSDHSQVEYEGWRTGDSWLCRDGISHRFGSEVLSDVRPDVRPQIFSVLLCAVGGNRKALNRTGSCQPPIHTKAK